MEPAVSPHSPEETKRFAFFLRGTLRLSAESVVGPGEYVEGNRKNRIQGEKPSEVAGVWPAKIVRQFERVHV